jgi:hypothetical protein
MNLDVECARSDVVQLRLEDFKGFGLDLVLGAWRRNTDDLAIRIGGSRKRNEPRDCRTPSPAV